MRLEMLKGKWIYFKNSCKLQIKLRIRHAFRNKLRKMLPTPKFASILEIFRNKLRKMLLTPKFASILEILPDKIGSTFFGWIYFYLRLS